MTRKTLFFVALSDLVLLLTLTPVFASDTSNVLIKVSKHHENGGELTITAGTLDINNPPPDYNRSSGAEWDDHGYGLDLTAPAKLMFQTPKNKQIGVKFTTGYYRGPIYNVPSARAPFALFGAKSTNNVSIFSNRNRSELVVAVDHGPIYTSTNSGMTWKIITAPGLHKFPLSTAPDGTGLYAWVPINPSNLPPVISSHTNAQIADWYAVASSPDGSKLVVSASLSQPAPTLNIRYSNTGVTIAWPAQFTNFTLEHITGLSEENWATVTNAVQVVDNENRVIVPPTIGNHFFRLRSR